MLIKSRKVFDQLQKFSLLYTLDNGCAIQLSSRTIQIRSSFAELALTAPAQTPEDNPILEKAKRVSEQVLFNEVVTDSS